MFQYGFELETFFSDTGKSDNITIPPKDYPHDGMAGLVELRSVSFNEIEKAYSQLIHRFYSGEVNYSKLIFMPYHLFTAEERRILRKRDNINKAPCDIQNIYDKKPRSLGNKTIASFQINVSNLIRASYVHKETTLPDQFGLFDATKIIKNLDREFKYEIQNSGRQAGEYCIKDNVRLEYRSLPNTVFETQPEKVYTLLKRIKSCTE